MPDFNAKMHPNRFRLGLRPRPSWESLAPPDLLAGFKGSTSKGRGRERTGREGREGKGRREGRGWEGRGAPPNLILQFNHWPCHRARSPLHCTATYVALHARMQQLQS